MCGIKIWRPESGASMVEFAVIAPVFLLVLLAGFDIGLAAYRKSAMQFAISKGLRWAILNQTNAPLTREQEIESQIISTAKSYGLDLEPAEITICSSKSAASLTAKCAVDSAGQPKDFIAIEATDTLNLIFGRFPVSIQALAVAQNEPA